MISICYVAYHAEPEDFFIISRLAPVHCPYINIIVVRNKVFCIDNEEVIKKRSFNWLIFKHIKFPVSVLNIKPPFCIVQEFLPIRGIFLSEINDNFTDFAPFKVFSVVYATYLGNCPIGSGGFTSN